MGKSFLLSFIALFVALDIIGILPMYIGMTRGLTEYQRNKVINTSMLVAFIVAVVFVFSGQAVFRFIGISLLDFKIAGGIVLLLISLADLVGGPSSTKKVSGSTGIVPLAVPLITGPGVLTTLVLQVASWGYLITLLALLANYVLGWIFLRYSHSVTRVIGKDGTVVVSKIAALLLAAIAIAMIRSGIFEAFVEYRASRPS
jgi:multiple antibiotic resistance protein